MAEGLNLVKLNIKGGMDFILTHYRPAMPFGRRKKNILEHLFTLVLSQFKIYHPSGNLKFNS